MRLGHLLSELRRRHVLRVVGAYAVAAWVAVEVYTTIQPILWEEHEWTNRLVVILALAGFPIVFALAWIFDITPHGVIRTAPAVPTSASGDPTSSPPGATSAPLAASPSITTGTAAGAGEGAGPRRVLSARAAGFFGLGILFAIVGLAAYAGMHHETAGGLTSDAPIESIAVLPFVDMSAGRDQEFFTDGVTEELMSRLSQVPGLRVAARTSSFAFKGRNDDVRQIGRTLSVQAVLEGSVRRDQDQLRVATKLIDVATGYQIWSDSFDGVATDVFALQDRIASAVVDALRQRFAAVPEAGRRGTSSVRAYELYLLGLKRWNLRTDRDLRQALAYFGDALQEDPQFALAHAGLAQTYAVLPFYGAFAVDTAVIRGAAAAAQAISYDPSLAEAYAAMGQIVQNFEWDLRGAESYYQRALKYQPGYTTAHQWYAEALMLLGRYAEAEEHSSRVLENDPLAHTGLYVRAFLGMLQGRTDDALAAWRDLARLHPDFELGVIHHALAAAMAGRRDEAVRSLHRLADLLPARASAYDAIAAALQDMARRDAAYEAIGATSALPRSEAAAWFMTLGNRTAALDALESGFREHADVNMPYMLVHPLMRPLRGDRRFRALIAETDLGFGG
jgi:TolB-like protein/tetratricopeptide (TPR) repeat protein